MPAQTWVIWLDSREPWEPTEGQPRHPVQTFVLRWLLCMYSHLHGSGISHVSAVRRAWGPFLWPFPFWEVHSFQCSWFSTRTPPLHRPPSGEVGSHLRRCGSCTMLTWLSNSPLSMDEADETDTLLSPCCRQGNRAHSANRRASTGAALGPARRNRGSPARPLGPGYRTGALVPRSAEALGGSRCPQAGAAGAESGRAARGREDGGAQGAPRGGWRGRRRNGSRRPAGLPSAPPPSPLSP